jgi:hypothetical protein
MPKMTDAVARVFLKLIEQEYQTIEEVGPDRSGARADRITISKLKAARSYVRSAQKEAKSDDQPKLYFNSNGDVRGTGF